MKINDYELVLMAQEGNEDATNIIYKKYTPLIIKKSKDAIKHARHHGIDINDIIQESYIALDEAIKNFRQDGDATFYTFSMLCVERRITNFIKKSMNNRSKILNEAISLDDEYGKNIGDKIDIENNFVTKADDYDRLDKLRRDLTSLEWTVLKLRTKGYSFEEISKILNKDLKSIYNCFNRIKAKYKKNIENDD